MKRKTAPAPDVQGEGMTPEMLMGPCIEVWAEAWPPGGPGREHSSTPAFAARRNWQAAVVDWAERSGWAHEGRPAMNACGLARMRIPYSLAYLRANGRGELADHLEGKTPDWPDEGDLKAAGVNRWALS